MDAGVPMKARWRVSRWAGDGRQQVRDSDRHRGAEDHYGDMDFKVAGTREGITALQMDIKIAGVNAQIMAEALEQAKKGRMYILGLMEQTHAEARQEISPHAPRIIKIKINPDKIRDVIGPGGKVIRALVEETGAKIDVEDDGPFRSQRLMAPRRSCVNRIKGLTAEAEIGATYVGTSAASLTSALSSRSSRAPTVCCTFRRLPTGAFATFATNSAKAANHGQVHRQGRQQDQAFPQVPVLHD
jgi:polyribonucleotide nucleotidyltransferase